MERRPRAVLLPSIAHHQHAVHLAPGSEAIVAHPCILSIENRQGYTQGGALMASPPGLHPPRSRTACQILRRRSAGPRTRRSPSGAPPGCSRGGLHAGAAGRRCTYAHDPGPKNVIWVISRHIFHRDTFKSSRYFLGPKNSSWGRNREEGDVRRLAPRRPAVLVLALKVHLHLGFGRIVGSEIQAPNMIAILVQSGGAVVQSNNATKPCLHPIQPVASRGR